MVKFRMNVKTSRAAGCIAALLVFFFVGGISADLRGQNYKKPNGAGLLWTQPGRALVEKPQR